MISLFEIDWGAQPFYWDAYDDAGDFIRVVGANELDEFLDMLRSKGIDFVLHTQEEYDEYHVALPPL